MGLTPLAKIIKEGLVVQCSTSMVSEMIVDIIGPVDLNELAEYIDHQLADALDRMFTEMEKKA